MLLALGNASPARTEIHHRGITVTVLPITVVLQHYSLHIFHPRDSCGITAVAVTMSSTTIKTSTKSGVRQTVLHRQLKSKNDGFSVMIRFITLLTNITAMEWNMFKMYRTMSAVVVFLLTVILTNVGQLSGPSFLMNEGRSSPSRCEVKSYRSSPVVLYPTRISTRYQRYKHIIISSSSIIIWPTTT